MWGCISTEASYQLNFNTSFSTTRSDVLVHLAQWQYWWWFWFAFLWSFYYLLVSKILRHRTLKMKPKIVTSYRPHGKWGDFLAAIIPGLWCLNILTNSNFILRLLEWQNESSLFTVRIRARQWYWVYKFEMRHLADILSTPKSIGRGKWFFSNFGDYQFSDSYLHLLQLRFKSRVVKNYWADIFQKMTRSNQNNNIGLNEFTTEKFNFNKNIGSTINLNSDNFYFSLLNNFKKSYNALEDTDSLPLNSNINSFVNVLNLKNYKDTLIINSKLYNFFFEKPNYFLNKINYVDWETASRTLKRSQGLNLPFRIIKYPFLETQNNFSSLFDSTSLFRVRFNNGVNEIKVKPLNDVFLFTIKQNKYKRRSVIPLQTRYLKDENGNKTSTIAYQGRSVLLNNSLFVDYFSNSEDVYNLFKKNRTRSEVMPVTLARRIIRTKRTLILPAHTNITLITNSFDVVHSWFVPGLGLKLDCVPGRSTHHTLYIDNTGFYYGQCAEICGRYHHHMPIRVCALPFEHFLIWWNVFGLPKVMFTTRQQRFKSHYAFRKFLW